MKQSIGIIGIGIMGHGMAENFLKRGWTVYLWNRSTAPMRDLLHMGGITCSSPKEVANRADVVFELTANDASSESVWLGETGILEGSSDQTILIASATLSIPWVDRLSKECIKRGRTFLDVPITGGRAGAEQGTLTMLCGGSKEVVESLTEVFSAIASKTYYFGPTGSGMRYKLILNFLQALHIVGFGEAMKIAKTHHLDLHTVADALSDRPGGTLTTIAKERYFTDPDPITFSITNAVKDLSYAKDFSSSLNTPLLDDVLALYKKALEHHAGDKDWGSINTLETDAS